VDEAATGPQRSELEAIMQTALEMGVQVQMSGGYTARVRDSMQHVALALGAERAETWVSSGSIGLAVNRGGWSRTSMRTAPVIGVNFAELSQLSRLAKRSPGMTLDQVRDEIAAIAGRDKRYPVPAVLVMLGVSCGSFAALFGADVPGITLATIGGLSGAIVRYYMMRRRFKPFVYCLFAAFVSVSMVLGLSRVLAPVDAVAPNTAVTASILFLVPGVPMLNGTADLLTSNYLNGVVRLTRASIIFMGATLGLALAVLLWGWL
jgi:uncharacterized membrane protein YjjP (DUF1212 family)